jgi:putative DNA primase/helicase
MQTAQWIDEFLSHFTGSVRGGPPRPAPGRPLTWYAICPAHEDNNPSLSIWLNRMGCLSVKCWSNNGCSSLAVLRESGLSVSDAYPPEQRRGATNHNPRPAQRVVDTTDFVDESGNLLYQEVRYLPKSFRLRRPLPGVGWCWSIDGVRRVLCRLDRLIANRTDPVWVTEGAKDMKAVEGLGFLATTAALGAGKWDHEFSRVLSRRDVILLADNDDAGREHAYHVLGSLLAAGAHSVRLAQLSGLGEHGDVSDWLSARSNWPDLGVRLVREVLNCPLYGPR